MTYRSISAGVEKIVFIIFLFFYIHKYIITALNEYKMLTYIAQILFIVVNFHASRIHLYLDSLSGVTPNTIYELNIVASK